MTSQTESKKQFRKYFAKETEHDVSFEFQKEDPERLTFNDSPVSFADVKDAWSKELIRNIPAMTGVTAAATAATAGAFALAGATAGSVGGPVGTAAGAIAGASAGKATALFVASKVIPGIMAGKDFLKFYFMKDDPRKFHSEEAPDNPEEYMDDFDKGLVKSMTLGYVNAGGEDSLARTGGEMAGAVLRDILIVSGLPVPKLGDFASTEAVTTTYFNMAMGINEGFEKYNEVKDIPSKKQDAIKLGLASGLGHFFGGQAGFVLMPRVMNKIGNKVLEGGISGFNPAVGGATFGSFDAVNNLTADMVVTGFEGLEDREISDEFREKLTPSQLAASIGGGAMFTGALWGPGRLLKALGGSVSDKFAKSSYRRNKRLAQSMVEEHVAKQTRTLYKGKPQGEGKLDMPQAEFDKLVKQIETMIEGGSTPQKAIAELLPSMPGEYVNDKTVLSLLENFNNVL